MPPADIGPIPGLDPTVVVPAAVLDIVRQATLGETVSWGAPPSEKRGQAQEKRGVYGVPAKLVTFSHTPRGHHSITAVLCAALARCNDLDPVQVMAAHYKSITGSAAVCPIHWKFCYPIC